MELWFICGKYMKYLFNHVSLLKNIHIDKNVF